jgi:hypothetical protein
MRIIIDLTCGNQEKVLSATSSIMLLYELRHCQPHAICTLDLEVWLRIHQCFGVSLTDSPLIPCLLSLT